MTILRKIKEGLLKLLRRKEEPRIKKAASLKMSQQTDSQRLKKEILGAHETEVGKSKFSSPETVQPIPKILRELSPQLGEDKIVLQTRDPWWIHAYWEVRPETLNSLKERLSNEFYAARIILRVYDISHIIFDGTNAHRFFDIEINYDANSWYIDTQGPGRSWCVDIGLRLANGEFIKIARSNMVHTPLEGPSWITDEEWMVPEDMFARLYGMGFGFGRSSPVGKAWQERMKRVLFSGVFASGGMASMASPVKKMPALKKFWMLVNTELIIYGATESDAAVTVQGMPIKLRPDGTFSLRFALPDGKQIIPVQGRSADGTETLTITPVVNKETK